MVGDYPKTVEKLMEEIRVLKVIFKLNYQSYYNYNILNYVNIYKYIYNN